MASNTNHFPNPSKLFLVVTLLAVGFVSTMYVLGQNTDNRQLASQAEDLNTSNPTMETINADGSMGPSNASSNFSKTLPPTALGNLAIKVGATSPGITPAITLKPDNDKSGSNKGKGKNEERGKEDEKSNKGNGRQTIESLKVSIYKVEVHLVKPCEAIYPTGALNQKNNSGKGNGSDKWEIVELDGTTVELDLVALAKVNIQESLALNTLACGTYSEVRLYVSKATATLTDKKEVPVTVAGKAGIVRVVRPFNISANKTTNLTLEFNAEKSVIKAGDFYILKPVVGKFTSN